MKQITIDNVTYNLVPVEQPKPKSPFHVADKEMNWHKAIDYAASLNMRMLRSEELHVLARDKHLPVDVGYAWSSSSVSDYTSNAWYVNLLDGNTFYNVKTNWGRIVCVPKDFSLEKFLTEADINGKRFADDGMFGQYDPKQRRYTNG